MTRLRLAKILTGRENPDRFHVYGNEPACVYEWQGQHCYYKWAGMDFASRIEAQRWIGEREQEERELRAQRRRC